MPRNGPAPDNFLYTWAYGPAFFVSLDSEHDYSAGSAQVTWLEGVLASVDRNVYPWLIVSLHHPILSSDSDEAGDHTPGAEKTVVFSPIFKQYAVDLVVQGHQHVYERTAAVYAATGEVVALPSGPNNVYSAPAAPVYIVQATAGAVLDGERWIAPTNWSLVRDGSQYGFGTMNLTTVGGNRVLSYAFVDVDDVVKDAWQIVKPA